MSNQPLIAWLDTETSGLDHKVDRILEIAIVVTDGDLNEIDSYEQKIKLSPTDRLAAHPRALEVNGYNDADWADAPLPCKEIWERVDEMTKGNIIGGQNVTQFDALFIAAEMLRFGIRPKWDRRMADVMGDSVRIMHLLNVRHPKGYPTAGLEFVYDALGGPPMPAHRAMADVRRAMFVYKYFDDAFRGHHAREMAALKSKLYDEGKISKAAFDGEFGGAGHGFDGNGSPVHD